MSTETNDTTAAGPVEKRIYIGGLHENVTDNNVRDLFSKFGTVTGVSVAKDALGECRGFGHMTLITTPKQWSSCLSNYNGSKWKGGKLQLEEAKPGYQERKAKEIELLKAKEEKKRKRCLRWNDSDGFLAKDMSLVTDSNMNNRQGWKRGRYGRAISVMKLTKNDGTRFVFDPTHYKNNLTKLYDAVVPTKPAASLPMIYEDSPKSSKPQGAQSAKPLGSEEYTRNPPLSLKTLDEEKRLAAMEQRQAEQHARRAIVSQALASVDSKNHTKFKDSDEDEEEKEQEERGEKEVNDEEEKTVPDFMISENDKGTRDGAKWLFDSDSEDHETDLDIKVNPVLEGSKGRERLALQSRFKGDERFKLDDAFMEDEEEEGEALQSATDPIDETAAELDAERDQSMDLLRAMFGESVMRPKQESPWSIGERYDPEAEDAADYLVKSSEQAQYRDGDVIATAEAAMETRRTSNVAPEVSSAKHYQVNVNMKPLFSGVQDAPFRLFSGADDDRMTDEDASAEIEENENDDMSNLVPKTDTAHVGLGLMFFFHMDEPGLLKRSCYAYDPQGIFQCLETDKDAYEHRWKERRNRIGQSFKRRQRDVERKQTEQATRDLK